MDSAYLPQEGQHIRKPHEGRRLQHHMMSTRRRSLSLLQLMSTEAQRPDWIQKLQNNRPSTHASQEETEQLLLLLQQEEQGQQQQQQPSLLQEEGQQQQQLLLLLQQEDGQQQQQQLLQQQQDEGQQQQQEPPDAWVHDTKQQKEVSRNYELPLCSHGQRTPHHHYHQQQHQREILSEVCMGQWHLVHSQTERQQQLPTNNEEKHERKQKQGQQQEFCSQRQSDRFHAEAKSEQGGRDELMRRGSQSSVLHEPIGGLYQPLISIKQKPMQEEQHRPEMLQQQSMQLWQHHEQQRCGQHGQGGGLETCTHRQRVLAKDEAAPSVEKKRETTAASSSSSPLCTGGDSLWITATYDKAEAQQPYRLHIHSGQRYTGNTISNEESKQSTTNGTHTLRPLCHINVSSCMANSSSHNHESSSRSNYSHSRSDSSSSSSRHNTHIKADHSSEGSDHNGSTETIFAGGIRECSTQTACSLHFTTSNSCCSSRCSSRKSSIYHDAVGHEDGSCYCGTCHHHSKCGRYTDTSGDHENDGCCCDTYHSICSYDKERRSSSTAYSDIRRGTTKSTQSSPLVYFNAPEKSALARGAEKGVGALPPVAAVRQEDDAVTSSLATLRATQTGNGAEGAIIDRTQRTMADTDVKKRDKKHIQMWPQNILGNGMLSCILSPARGGEEKKKEEDEEKGKRKAANTAECRSLGGVPNTAERRSLDGVTNTAEGCSWRGAYKCGEEVRRSAVSAEKATSRIPSSENMTAAAKAAAYPGHGSGVLSTTHRGCEESATVFPPGRIVATVVISAEESTPAAAAQCVEPSSSAWIHKRGEPTSTLSQFKTVAATALPSGEEPPVAMVVAPCRVLSSAAAAAAKEAGPSSTNDGPIELKSTEQRPFARRLLPSSCRSEESFCEGDRESHEGVFSTYTDKSLVSSDVYATDIQTQCNATSLLSLQENEKLLNHSVSAPVSGSISVTRRKLSSDRSVTTAQSKHYVACRGFAANAESLVVTPTTTTTPTTTPCGTVASSLPSSTTFISTRPSFSRPLPPMSAAVPAASALSLKPKHHFQPCSNIGGAAAAATGSASAAASSIQANRDASITFPQNIYSAHTLSTEGNTVISAPFSSRVSLKACTSAAAAATDVLPHAPAILQHIPPCAGSSPPFLCLHTATATAAAAAEAACDNILSPSNLTFSDSTTATAPGVLATTVAAARDAAVTVAPAATAAIACVSAPVEVAAAPTATTGATATYAAPTATVDAATAEQSLEPATAVAASAAIADAAPTAAAMCFESADGAAAPAVHPPVGAASTTTITTTYTAPLAAPACAIHAASTAPAAAPAAAVGAFPAVTTAHVGTTASSASATTAVAMTTAPPTTTAVAMTTAPTTTTADAMTTAPTTTTAVAMTAVPPPTALAMTAGLSAHGVGDFVEVVCPGAGDIPASAAGPRIACAARMAEAANVPAAAAPAVDAVLVTGAVPTAPAPPTTIAAGAAASAAASAAMTARFIIGGGGPYVGIDYPVASDYGVDAACKASRSSCFERVGCCRLGCAAERRAKQRWRMLLRRSQRRHTRARSSSSSSYCCMSLSSSLSSYTSTSSHNSETDEENFSEDMGAYAGDSWGRQQQQQIQEEKEDTTAAQQQQQQQPAKPSQHYPYESTVSHCSVRNPIIWKGSLRPYTKCDSALARTASAAAVAVAPHPPPRASRPPPRRRRGNTRTCATASADANNFSSDISALFLNKHHHCVSAGRSSPSSNTAISTSGKLPNRGDTDSATWEGTATTTTTVGAADDTVSLSAAAAAPAPASASSGRSIAACESEKGKRRGEKMRRGCAAPLDAGIGCGSTVLQHLHQTFLGHDRPQANTSCSAVPDTHMFASAEEVDDARDATMQEQQSRVARAAAIAAACCCEKVLPAAVQRTLKIRMRLRRLALWRSLQLRQALELPQKHERHSHHQDKKSFHQTHQWHQQHHAYGQYHNKEMDISSVCAGATSRCHSDEVPWAVEAPSNNNTRRYTASEKEALRARMDNTGEDGKTANTYSCDTSTAATGAATVGGVAAVCGAAADATVAAAAACEAGGWNSRQGSPSPLHDREVAKMNIATADVPARTINVLSNAPTPAAAYKEKSCTTHDGGKLNFSCLVPSLSPPAADVAAYSHTVAGTLHRSNTVAEATGNSKINIYGATPVAAGEPTVVYDIQPVDSGFVSEAREGKNAEDVQDAATTATAAKQHRPHTACCVCLQHAIEQQLVLLRLVNQQCAAETAAVALAFSADKHRQKSN